jgi:hypothetical protein
MKMENGRLSTHMGDCRDLFDELWDLADVTVSEHCLATHDPIPVLPPLLPLEPMPLVGDPDPLQQKDPLSLLRTAGDMAAAGRQKEAQMCRKTAMSMLQALT